MRKHNKKVSIEFDIEYNEVEWKGNWIPQTVYKYRDWHNRKHRRILKNLQIWIPDSLDFNDPFDCNIPVAYDLVAKDEKIGEQFVRNLVEAHVNKFGGELETEFKLRLAEGKHKDLNFLEQYKRDLHETSRKYHGIFTVTPVNNNILMWSHYANSHKGFCIGFDSKIIFEHLVTGGGPVLYNKTYPTISRLIHVKSSMLFKLCQNLSIGHTKSNTD
jgi:hypothetical protein